jgi:hypothetical protein
LNVDSQSSFQNILVSVIGEISNKSEPSRKFVQTFVLAEQPNGYYVLNDIFRYLSDEDEEIVTEEVPAEEASTVEEDSVVEVQQPQSVVPDPNAACQADDEITAEQVDEKLEKVAVDEDVKPKAEENVQKADNIEANEEQAETTAPPEATIPVIPATTEVLQPEKPKEPLSTPIVTPPKAATPTPEKEPTPVVKPPSMTWASVASNRSGATALVATPVAVPVAPIPQPKVAPNPPQPTALVTGEGEKGEKGEKGERGERGDSAASQSSSGTGTEWQTAGPDHSRRQSRQQSLSGPADEQNTLGYIKNVNEKVDASVLRQTLSRFGKLKYFDVSRQRVCIAFRSLWHRS